MIGGLIKHFEQDSEDIFTASMYALGICICAVIPTVIHHPFVVAVLQAGMRMRVACCALLYKKVYILLIKKQRFVLVIVYFYSFSHRALVKIIISYL